MIKHKRVLTLLLLFSFIFIPTKRIISNINYRKELTSFSKTVKVTGNVASNEEWNESLYIAYFNNAKYYGITKGSEKDILQNIHDKHITYYLIWKEGSSYSFLSTFNKVQETPDLTVYKVN